MTVLAVSAAVSAGMVGLGGCARRVHVTLPTVPSTVALPPITTRPPGPSHAFDEIPTLPGGSTTTTAVAIANGTVTLSGTVSAPDGRIGGATVHIERLVDGGIATLDVTADAQGRYRADNIQGGRLRVRAWRVPDVAGSANVVVFAAGDTTLDLRVTRYGGTDVQWAIAPSAPRVGDRVNLVVQVSTSAVGPTGLASVQPLDGVGVRVVALGGLQPPSADERLTDADGRVLFTLTCNAAGSADLDVNLATGEKAQLRPPVCAAAPATEPPTLPPAAAPTVEPEPTTAVPVDVPGSLVPVPVVPQNVPTSVP